MARIAPAAPNRSPRTAMSSDSKTPAAAVRSPDRVIVFDTTLRDGEQSPGFSMNLGQKLRVARALQELGVDVIEAGFAAASPGDLEAIQGVSRQIEGPIICSLSRCTRGDIEASWKALQDAPRRRCHVFLATSPIHRDFKLKMAKEEIIRRAVEGVKMARERFEDVEFSTEDAARTELEFLAQVVEAAIEAGATTLNIPDTVGYALPSTYAETLSYLRQARAGHRPGGDLGPLPQRPRAGGGQQPGRRAGGRAPGRVHPERHRRAGRQRLPGGGGHGHQDPPRRPRGHHRHPHREALPGQQDGAAGHRQLGAAQQGHRRAERLRPRGRHPPARHAHPPGDLRDHAPGGGRLHQVAAGAGQALRTPRPPVAARRAGLPPHRRAARHASSWTSSCWPTRRRRSTTPTWRRW